MESIELKYPNLYKVLCEELYKKDEFHSLWFDDEEIHLVDKNEIIIGSTLISEIQGYILGKIDTNRYASLATDDLYEWEQTIIEFNKI